jgi:hypothetical protein
MTPPSVKRIPKRVARRILSNLDRARALYVQTDNLVALLVATVPVGATVTLGDATYVLVDNYAHANRVYRSHGISRFELKEVK